MPKFFRALALALAAALALAGCAELKSLDELTVRARVGVLAAPQLSWAAKSPALRKALERFRAEKADAVIIIGELTAGGAETQYAELARLWRATMSARVKLVLVRGPEEDRAWRDAFAAPFPDGTLILPPAGGEFEIEGRRFGAGYFKKWDNKKALPWFYGQGRYALTDEIGAPQRTLGNFYAGSMSGITIPDDFDRLKGLDSVAQGLLVKAYPDETVALRLDFSTGEEVAAPWRLAPDSTAIAAAETAAPQFWDDASLLVIRGTANDGHALWTLKFPPVLARHTGVRAFYYEIAVDGIGVVRRVLPPGFWLSEDRAQQALSLTLDSRELPDDPHFSVTPISSLGVRGRALRK